MANRDGSGSRPLTKFAGGWLGSPSWSADGQRIAFDALQGQTWSLCIVPANGGIIQTLVSDAFNNIRLSWSPDGRWIYFASDRTGKWQIWKVPSAGGTPQTGDAWGWI